jgi:hypothetical protein
VENRFRQALLEAVDTGLQQILGDSGRKATYFHLQRMYSLTREDIPNNPAVFASGLEKIFGVGANVIEESIVKNLYSKLGIKYEKKKGARFVDYLQDIIERK